MTLLYGRSDSEVLSGIFQKVRHQVQGCSVASVSFWSRAKTCLPTTLLPSCSDVENLSAILSGPVRQ
jgi:hypothetical protein